MIGVILAIAIVIRSGIVSLTEITIFDMNYLWGVVWGFAQMIISIAIAIVSIYLALWILKRFMEGKGNKPGKYIDIFFPGTIKDEFKEISVI